MQDVEKVLDEILLKLNILCGKVDTLEFKVNSMLDEVSLPQQKVRDHLPVYPPKVGQVGKGRGNKFKVDTKTEIEKIRTELMAKIQKTIKDVENKNVIQEIGKPSK